MVLEAINVYHTLFTLPMLLTDINRRKEFFCFFHYSRERNSMYMKCPIISDAEMLVLFDDIIRIYIHMKFSTITHTHPHRLFESNNNFSIFYSSPSIVVCTYP